MNGYSFVLRMIFMPREYMNGVVMLKLQRHHTTKIPHSPPFVSIIAFFNKIFQGFYTFRCVKFELLGFVNY
jgi:hypothetical protein